MTPQLPPGYKLDPQVTDVALPSGYKLDAPIAPAPPGFGQRVYEQTLQGPVELAKALKADPAATLKQTAANLFGVSQYQAILKQLQAGQYLPAAISILSFKNPAQMQAEAMTTPAIEDVRTGNLRGLAGDVVGGGLALFGAEAIPKVIRGAPGVAKVTAAGVRAAAPDVAGGALKVGAGALMEHVAPGASPLKYALEGYTGYAGARQIGRGLKKGVAATRQALRDRATAAADLLANERAAAPAGVQPVPAGALRALPEPATRMPPAADTSFVQAVQAELPEVLSPTLRSKPAAATAAEQLREEMIKSGSITPDEPTPITRQSGAEKIVEARNAKAERFVEPFQRFEFSTKDVKDFGPSEWEVFAKAIGEDVPSPDTIAQILLRMGKRK